MISITLNGDWQMPYDDNPESTSFVRIILCSAYLAADVDAAQHALDFAIGSFHLTAYSSHC